MEYDSRREGSRLDDELEVTYGPEVNGLARPDEPPVLHFAKRQDMVAWLPQSLDAA